jgi:hypothetical protein
MFLQWVLFSFILVHLIAISMGSNVFRSQKVSIPRHLQFVDESFVLPALPVPVALSYRGGLIPKKLIVKKSWRGKIKVFLQRYAPSSFLKLVGFRTKLQHSKKSAKTKSSKKSVKSGPPAKIVTNSNGKNSQQRLQKVSCFIFAFSACPF